MGTQDSNQGAQSGRQILAAGVSAGKQSIGTPTGTQTRPVWLVFVLDATESMTLFIRGVREALVAFLGVLTHGNLAPAVGLVVFRDELMGDMPEIYPVGTAPAKLKTVLANTSARDGGDVPESSYPAIARAVQLLSTAPQGAAKVILHITDAPPHEGERQLTQTSIKDTLKREKILFHACTPLIEPYTTFSNATGGTLFPLTPDLDENTFSKLLIEVAHTTRKTLKASADEIAEALRESRRRNPQG